MMEDEIDYSDDFIDYDEVEYHYSFNSVVNLCIHPTVQQTFKFIWQIWAFNILFFILSRTVARKNECIYHVLSTIIGLSNIFYHFYSYNTEALCIIPLVYVSYLIVPFQKAHEYTISAVSIGTAFVSILIGCEFFYYDHEKWLKIRSVVMIIMMKIISLIYDYHENNETISLWEYSGYIWCPANTILGPWLPYKKYLLAHKKRLKINLNWAWALVKYMLFAFVFVCISNCVNPYFIEDEYDLMIGDVKLFTSYRDASCFRMSHYFVSFIASGFMVTAGYTSDNQKEWVYDITHPLETELPRSLVNVVIYWNIPTHVFLRKYVFPKFLPFGRFAAIFMTYFVSSMLHGLSIQVSVVLLSLGIFSYAEFVFRDAVATLSDACVKARPCRNCKHTKKSNSVAARLLNILFFILTVINLLYIGCLMETMNTPLSNMEIIETIWEKWSGLYYIGHAIVACCLMGAWLIKRICKAS